MVVSNRYEPDPRVHKEAMSLVAAGHRVRVYAFDRLSEMAKRDEILDGVELHRLQLGRFRSGRMISMARGLLRFHRAVRKQLLADPADVVHCHDQDTCAIGLWWQRQRARDGGRGRFVFDAHDFYWTYPLMSDLDSRWQKFAAHATSRLLEITARRHVRRADLLITVSQAIAAHAGFAERYRRWGVSPLVLWNAPVSVQTPPPLPARFTLGYFGVVREPAMFRWLMAAIATLPPGERPDLRIAGTGVEFVRVQRYLEREARRLGVALRMTGAFAMRDLGALMAECSAQFCVYPLASGNMAYTVPVKIFDAVAHGRKVIGTADTLMADWIGAHGWGEVVREGDHAGLGRALQALRAEVIHRTLPPSLAPPPRWADQGEKLCAAYEKLLDARNFYR